jgi:hypothetical protein
MKYFIITLLLILVPIVGGCILAILDTMWDIAEGVTVNEISERTGVGISTIYKIKKMQRDMEAK